MGTFKFLFFEWHYPATTKPLGSVNAEPENESRSSMFRAKYDRDFARPSLQLKVPARGRRLIFFREQLLGRSPSATNTVEKPTIVSILLIPLIV